MTTIKLVNATTLKSWLERNEAIVIDVREMNEYLTGSIPNAILIPLGSIQKEKLPNAANKKIVLHCAVGKRSAMACEKLLREDPNLDLYNLEGGFKSWEASGFDVKRSGKKIITLEQQVQITIASAILLGLLLGYFIHPVFLMISVLFALLQLFIGFTASPRLTMFLSNAPWNKRGS